MRISTCAHNWLERVRYFLVEEGAVEVDPRGRVTDVMADLRSKFPNNEIKRFRDAQEGGRWVILITGEKIRTNRNTTDTTGAEGAEGVTQRRCGRKPTPREFLDDLPLCGTCKICGRTLPSSEFGIRLDRARPALQSYCKECTRAYALWRHNFLKEHNAKQLSTEYTVGHKERSVYFHQFLQEWTHQLEQEKVAREQDQQD